MNRVTLILCGVLLLSSCSTYNPCSQITYISLRPTIVKDLPIPDNAHIAVYYSIDSNYKISVLVQNLTDDILTIDQTRSFFINTKNESTAYYDPTVKTASKTSTTGSTSSSNFNFGVNIFGNGCAPGSLIKTTTLDNSNTTINSSTVTQIMADMPKVSIGPRGKMVMSKTFDSILPTMNQVIISTPETSPAKFMVTICYSFDNGKTSESISTDFYVNSFFIKDVVDRHTNDAVRYLLTTKPNATIEPWYMVWSSRGDKFTNQCIFLNYK